MTGFKLMVPLSTSGKITTQKIQARHYQSTTGPLDKRLVLLPQEKLAAGKANRDFDRRATLGGLFSALTGTNGSTSFKRQRNDYQGSDVDVARSKRCLLS